jgi:hypothetical protein
MTSAYRPTDEQIRHFWNYVRAMVALSVGRVADEYGTQVAADIAECFRGEPGAAGTWCIRTRCDVTDDGQPDVDTLRYRICFRADDDWQLLCDVTWPVLVPREWADYECQTLAMAHGLGIPDTAAELFEPPADPPDPTG